MPDATYWFGPNYWLNCRWMNWCFLFVFNFGFESLFAYTISECVVWKTVYNAKSFQICRQIEKYSTYVEWSDLFSFVSVFKLIIVLSFIIHVYEKSRCLFAVIFSVLLKVCKIEVFAYRCLFQILHIQMISIFRWRI